MALTVVGSLPLGAINISANAAAGIIGPLLGQLDLLLFAGLTPLQVDIAAQLNAALQAQIQISNINPFAQIQAAISALAALQANLNIGLPTIGVSASASVSAALAAKLGGLQLLIAAAIAVKLPAVDFLAALQANLTASVVLASFGFATPSTSLAATGVDIQTAFAGGIGGILPGQNVFGLLLVTANPSASVSLSATMRTS